MSQDDNMRDLAGIKYVNDSTHDLKPTLHK